MRLSLTLISVLTISHLSAQPIPKSYYEDLSYRMIGPFRAGRTVGVTGVPSRPNNFFMGVNNGGVWKTDDYGRTWKPIFDSAPTGSVGDVAVSASNPDIIYVGSGEGLHRPDLGVGDGVFKSMDGGKSWAHLGLEDVQQIARIIVHPTNPDMVVVAGLGHPYGANEMRGVYRSEDGGKNWARVLFINNHTGATQVEFDPTNPQVLYSSMWEHQEGPWENASFSGTHSGLYKSVDGGTTWRQLTAGLPTTAQGLGRIGIGIAPSNPKRIYATVDAKQMGGIYRSDDGGESWYRVNDDHRLWGRGSDFAEIKVHPINPDVLFVANIASYKSTDGGKTWMSIKGAPGGDDYHRIWINPSQPDIMIFAADQGATITVNGGKTWSSWYNQPTAQLYHVSTDNAFPYWVYGGQQESGAMGTASRGPGGQISFRDWMGVGSDEYAYVAPDPKDPNIIYGGRVMRFDKRTGQSQYVGPEVLRSGNYRMLRTLPLLFHPQDDNMLLFATNVLWKTMNGGQDWEIISPDLTRQQPEVPTSVGDFKTDEMETMPQRGVIYAVGPSPVDKKVIWAGTDDGLVHVTQDGGKTWKEVTPPDLKSWDKISQIDAGHFDAHTAYLAVNAIRKDDMLPHIYKTRDGGATWTKIVNGLPKSGPVNVVREDKKQPGLLFAGTEREVYFSVDDGAQWQSLRVNMPTTSVRDLVIHENDLVVATHGRSIWIMDNIQLLRELTTATTASIYLVSPPEAYRVRDNMFFDTPLPPEEPAGQNPPDGVTIDYVIQDNQQALVLEIISPQGEIVRRYSSEDVPDVLDTMDMPHPTYWIKPYSKVATEPGHHRVVWDMRYAPPRGTKRQLDIAAVYQRTPTGPQGPLVAPGHYTVRLKAGSVTLEKPVVVKMDPRVKVSDMDLQLQTDYSMACYQAYHELQTMRDAIEAQLGGKRKLKKIQYTSLSNMVGVGAPELPNVLYGSIYETDMEKETIVSLQDKFLHVLAILQSADARPTTATVEAVKKLNAAKEGLRKKWEGLR